MTILLAVGLIVPVGSQGEINSVALEVKGRKIQVELAMTEQARAKGLMYRNSLCSNCGMLFVFPAADKWAFWSKNTPLALSVAFVDRAGRIRQIVDMEANSMENHVSNYDVTYALEMKRGWFADNGIAVGQIVSGLTILK